MLGHGKVKYYFSVRGLRMRLPLHQLEFWNAVRRVLSIPSKEDDMKRSWAGVALLAVALAITATAQTGAQTGQDEYIAPSHITANGKAPRMKVQLLSENGKEKTYAVIFYKGDEAYSGLTQFAREYHVTAAHFTAIGALSKARFAWFDPARKEYRVHTYDGQIEVASMVGDIALYKGKPGVHTHMVIALPDGTTRGGHVVEADVNPTLEVMVTVEPNAMHKRFDPPTDLTLIDPAVHE